MKIKKNEIKKSKIHALVYSFVWVMEVVKSVHIQLCLLSCFTPRL